MHGVPRLLVSLFTTPLSPAEKRQHRSFLLAVALFCCVFQTLMLSAVSGGGAGLPYEGGLAAISQSVSGVIVPTVMVLATALGMFLLFTRTQMGIILLLFVGVGAGIFYNFANFLGFFGVGALTV